MQRAQSAPVPSRDDDAGAAAARRRQRARLTTAAPNVRTAPAAEGPLCTCGHGKQAHQHYRRGKDCARCTCPRFRRHSFLPRLLRR